MYCKFSAVSSNVLDVICILVSEKCPHIGTFLADNVIILYDTHVTNIQEITHVICFPKYH